MRAIRAFRPPLSILFATAALIAAALLASALRPDETRTTVCVNQKLPAEPSVSVHFKTHSLEALRVPSDPLLTRPGITSADLLAWRHIAVPARLADAFLDELRADPNVVTAFVAPEPQLARVEMPDEVGPAARSCPIDTPSYQPYQGYLGEAPAGINAPAAWLHPGGRGQGVTVADVEGAWNATHEDLPGDRMRQVAGRETTERGWVAHGTAVVGVLAARDNGIGMVGIVPDVDGIVTASIRGTSVADAIDRAAAALDPGDILLIELHAIGPRGRFLPMEYWDDVYDVVRAATDRGVIVVAAAGNGNENLDHRAYRGKLTREVRDSGAILVGAGAPARDGWTDRSRLYFSNYGSRVDVQGWGFHVATLDYGDLQDCDAHDRKYTGQFGGTSSASPVVVGAAAALQGIARARWGKTLTPREMREVLAATGSPQVDGPDGPASQHIGPRPDLARAITALETRYE